MADELKGLGRGLTNYGDPDFSIYLRRSFASAMGYSREMLARANHHFGNARLLGFAKNIVQQRIRRSASFLRHEEVGFLEIHRVDLRKLDKIHDVNGLGRFDVDASKIFVLQHDELTFFVFVPLDDLTPWHLPAIRLCDALVVHRA